MKFTIQGILLLVIAVFSVICQTHSASLQAVKKTNDRYTSNDEAKASHEVKKDEGEIEKLEDNAGDNDEEEIADDLEGKDDNHEENDPREKDSKEEKSEEEKDEEDEPEQDDKEKSDDIDNNGLEKGIADAKEANNDLQKQIDLLNHKLQNFLDKKQKSTDTNNGEKSKNAPEGSKDQDPDQKSKTINKNNIYSKDEQHKSHKIIDSEGMKDDISNEEITDDELERDVNLPVDQDSKKVQAKKKDERTLETKEKDESKQVKKDTNTKDSKKENQQDKRKEGDKKEDVTILGPDGEMKDQIRRDKTGRDEDNVTDDDY